MTALILAIGFVAIALLAIGFEIADWWEKR